MKTLLAFALLFSLGFAPQSKDKIRVYVFTAIDPAGLVDQAQKDRLDSVRDIAGKLSGRRFVVVQTAEQADIRIEVLARGWWRAVDWDRRPAPRVGPTRNVLVVDVTLFVGADYRTNLRGSDVYTWAAAASDCANQVDRWVKDNRARILAARAK
jgi:hypothetical protein